MNEIIRLLAQYDYWLLTGAILGRQAFLPIRQIWLLLQPERWRESKLQSRRDWWTVRPRISLRQTSPGMKPAEAGMRCQ